jgi:hypothetical protein
MADGQSPHCIEKQIAAQYANTDFSTLKVGTEVYKQWRPAGK